MKAALTPSARDASRRTGRLGLPCQALSRPSASPDAARDTVLPALLPPTAPTATSARGTALVAVAERGAPGAARGAALMPGFVALVV